MQSGAQALERTSPAGRWRRVICGSGLGMALIDSATVAGCLEQATCRST